jgi:hypothetical protein
LEREGEEIYKKERERQGESVVVVVVVLLKHSIIINN